MACRLIGATLLTAAVAASVGAWAHAHSPSGQRAPAPQDFIVPFLERYERGEYDSALTLLTEIRALPSRVELGPAADPRKASREIVHAPFNDFVGTFANVARDWLSQASGPARETRLRSLAVAILEIENDRRLRGGSDQLKSAVEWICQELRNGPTNTFERRWLLASIALGVGGDHVGHALRQFPDESRFRLARVTEEQATRIASNHPGVSPVRLVRRGDVATDKAALKFLATVLDRLDALAPDPAIGFEAQLRAGVIRFQLADLDRGLRDLTAASRSDDPFVCQVANLYRGLALSAMGRPDDALDAYRAAHEALPTGQSAALRLAAALFLADKRDDAARVAAAATPYPVLPDPWNAYGWADYRFWDSYLLELREALKK